jgi:hypothetical protein
MDHLTINISGYVPICVSPMVALTLTLLCLRRTTQHHPGVREQQHHRADHAPGLPLGHEPAREPRISRARRERCALRLAEVGDCSCFAALLVFVTERNIAILLGETSRPNSWEMCNTTYASAPTKMVTFYNHQRTTDTRPFHHPLSPCCLDLYGHANMRVTSIVQVHAGEQLNHITVPSSQQPLHHADKQTNCWHSRRRSRCRCPPPRPRPRPAPCPRPFG